MKELRASFSPGNRFGTGLVGIEGEHLLLEAIRSSVPIATIFFRSGSEALLERLTPTSNTEIIELPPDIFAGAVTTESPQGIAALVKPRTFSLDDLLRGARPLIVIAAALQDPGNLGTLIRSAEAFGATGVITLPGTVSPWNAKALRASSGSAFRLPVIAERAETVFPALQSAGIQVLAAVADAGTDITLTALDRPTAIVIGNEGSGLSAELLAQADRRVTIPCPGPVESLNAAIAGGILLYESARQRSASRRDARP